MKRNENDYKKTKTDVFCELLFWVGVPVVVGICCLFFSLTAKASGTESTAYFPMTQNANNLIPDTYYDYIYQQLDGDNYNFCIYYRYDAYNSKYFYFYRYPKTDTGMVCFEISNNGYQFTPYRIGTLSLFGGEIQVPYTFAYNNIVYYAGPLGYWESPQSNLYNTNIDYRSNYKVWTSNNENTRSVALKYGYELPPDFDITGHAVPPDTFESPVYTTGHSHPQNVPPTYTVNNYTWTTYTPPTVDTSSLENLVKSLIDITKYNAEYLKDNLHNEFTNLITNLKGLFDYIGQTIDYYGDLIISNIQNGITTFYNNMANLVTGIKDGIGFITQPLDMTAVTYSIGQTSLMSDVGSIGTIKTEAFGVFNSVDEPQTFKIPLDLRSITMLGQTQITYIDLGWLADARPYIRAFMWVAVTFGLLYSIIIDIPTMLRSGAK